MYNISTNGIDEWSSLNRTRGSSSTPMVFLEDTVMRCQDNLN